jgi:hypothetical protein
MGHQIVNPQIAKICGPQIANQQITTFVEGPKKNEVCKLWNCNLRKLFADRPPLPVREKPNNFVEVESNTVH